MLDLSSEHFHVEFHETGRAACFWIDVHEDPSARHLSAQARMERLITRALVPVIDALEATGEINGKLIWSNTGYLIHWYLTEMKPLLGDEKVDALRQSCFFARQLSDGRDNPLYRTVVPREDFWYVVPAVSATVCRTSSSAAIARLSSLARPDTRSEREPTLKTATCVAVLLLPKRPADFPLLHYAVLLPLPAEATVSRTP